MNSLALYLSTPTPPHTLHAYKLHEKNAPQVQSTEFKISHCLVAAQRFEKQGETFFQLLRFVIPESENYCYCPVICRSHNIRSHVIFLSFKSLSDSTHAVDGDIVLLQNKARSLTTLIFSHRKVNKTLPAKYRPKHNKATASLTLGGSRVQIFPLICHQSATALIHTHIHIQ